MAVAKLIERIQDAGLSDRFISKRVVTEALGVSLADLNRRVATGRFPAPLKDGKRCFWRASTVDQFIREYPGAMVKHARKAKGGNTPAASHPPM